MVRLITHNLLACHAKGCTSNNFPLKLQDVTVEVNARAVGWSARTDFPIPVMHHELRLSLESALADRRGLPR